MEKYDCPYCNYYFYSRESLNKHVADEHHREPRGQEILRQRGESFLEKMFLPSGEHPCPYCNYTFFSTESLQKHIIDEHTKS